MRAVVWDRSWDDEYDDLSSFEPGRKWAIDPLPVPPLPPTGQWRPTGLVIRDGARFRPTGVWLVAGLLTFINIAILAGSAFALARLDSDRDWLPGLGLAIGSVMPLLVFWILEAFGEGPIAPPEVRELARYLGQSDLYPVRIHVVQNGKLTGIDRGVAWFDRDALHFHGVESEFVIGAQDLKQDPTSVGFGHGALEHGLFMPSLALRHPDRSISVTMEPMSRLYQFDPRDCAFRFRRELRLFLSHWRQSHAESQYPPLTIQPSLAVRLRKAVQVISEAEEPTQTVR